MDTRRQCGGSAFRYKVVETFKGILRLRAYNNDIYRGGVEYGIEGTLVRQSLAYAGGLLSFNKEIYKIL